MKIKKLKTYNINAGWRVWSFLIIYSDSELYGISEFSESNGSYKAIDSAIYSLENLIIDKSPINYKFIIENLKSKTIQSKDGIIQKAIACIENSLIDLTAKSFDVPVYKLFGGKYIDELNLYWSHCGTTRVRAFEQTHKKKISNYEDQKRFCDEINKSGFKHIKTNLAVLGENPFIYMPGSNKSINWPNFSESYLLEKEFYKWIKTFKDYLDEDILISVDLNFNFRKDGYKRIINSLNEFNLKWIELDVTNSLNLNSISKKSNTPLCSGENSLGVENVYSLISKNDIDYLSVDVLWNGFYEAQKIAVLSSIFNINITPHNFNSHLSTMINAHYSASIPNFCVLEYDFDDVPWRDNIVDNVPEIKNGKLIINDKPGWGIDLKINELEKYAI